MLRIFFALCIVLSANAAVAQGLTTLEVGDYLLDGRSGSPKPFSVAQSGEKWEIKSADPSFPLRMVNCLSNCDFRPMPVNLQQSAFPQFTRQFAMSCIANTGFALCKMTNKPMPQCGDPTLKAGDFCQIGAQPPGKSLYGLFALSAPGVMPISVTRVQTN